MTAALHNPRTSCERKRKEVETKIDCRLLGGAGQEDLS